MYAFFSFFFKASLFCLFLMKNTFLEILNMVVDHVSLFLRGLGYNLEMSYSA